MATATTKRRSAGRSTSSTQGKKAVRAKGHGGGTTKVMRANATKKKSVGKRATSKSLPAWLVSVEAAAKRFAKDNDALLRWSDKQLAAAFEVGCFHALLGFYEAQGYRVTAKNLKDGVYKYLTSPSGNPDNFSYAHVTGEDGDFEIRQQVRIESHINTDIAFTPDIVVLHQGAELLATTDADFAAGKRRFFRVRSEQVVAAHECKSMNPFPELMVNFIGMLVVAHSWHERGSEVMRTHDGGHLAPTLFVGGSVRGLHLRMISALQGSFTLNVVCGMHEGTWSLTNAKNRIVVNRPQRPSVSPS